MLTFEQFGAANHARCQDARGFNHPLDSWSLSDWMTLEFLSEFDRVSDLFRLGVEDLARSFLYREARGPRRQIEIDERVPDLSLQLGAQLGFGFLVAANAVAIPIEFLHDVGGLAELAQCCRVNRTQQGSSTRRFFRFPGAVQRSGRRRAQPVLSK